MRGSAGTTGGAPKRYIGRALSLRRGASWALSSLRVTAMRPGKPAFGHLNPLGALRVWGFKLAAVSSDLATTYLNSTLCIPRSVGKCQLYYGRDRWGGDSAPCSTLSCRGTRSPAGSSLPAGKFLGSVGG